MRTALWLMLAATSLVGCHRPAHGLASPSANEPDALSDDVSSERQDSSGHIRIGTFNVRRFYDTRCDSGSCGGSAFEPAVSVSQFDAKARSIVRSIEAMNVDFVLLQEIESEACMDALQLRLGDRYSIAYLGEIGVPASADVALLGKGTLREVVTHRQDKIALASGELTTFSRELPEVHIDYQGHHVVLIPLHFRSKYNDDPARRLAEAVAARAITEAVAQAYPEAIIVLGGDVNDVPGSPPLEALEAHDTLDAVYDDLPKYQRWTNEYKGETAMIDHLFVARRSGGELVAGSTHVLRDEAGGFGDSDHAALIATIAPIGPF